MSDVENIMKMAFCTEEVAKTALAKTGNLIDSVCMILDFKPILAPKQKVMDDEQLMFKEMRVNMEKIEESIQKGFKKTDQPVSSYPDLQDTRNPQLQSFQHYDRTLQNHQEAPAKEE